MDNAEKAKTSAERLRKLVGRFVVVECTTPVPVFDPKTGAAVGMNFCPTKVKLVDVFEDGFEATREGGTEPAIFLFANTRSITPVTEIVQPKLAIPMMPGRNS